MSDVSVAAKNQFPIPFSQINLNNTACRQNNVDRGKCPSCGTSKMISASSIDIKSTYIISRD